ncbi:MAG: HAD family hydrolase [Lachnospiraceae bacterium]|nr:HAD family hydrolase [Lachnospiraceae bacterium]
MLLFFDIDGTLWDYKNYIPDSTRKAIRTARKNGHKAFLNSGRSRAFITNEDLLGIGFDGIVSACGTRVEYMGETIFEERVPYDLAEFTVRTANEHGFRNILEGPEYLYMDKDDFYGDMYGEKVMKEMGDRLLSIKDNWGKWEMNKLSSATNVEEDRRQECFRLLEPYYDFLIHNTLVVEMVPKGHTKGTGIKKVCELLGESIENTFAFGDSINDLDMLKDAGHGIAMGNGTDTIKEVADHITTDMMDDGIHNAMLEFGLI